MKTMAFTGAAIVFATVLLSPIVSPLHGQEMHRQTPVPVRPLTHPAGLSKIAVASLRSFYSAKANWQHIIDSTWGPGLPLATQWAIFDSYANAVRSKFDGFLSLGLTPTSWDSLKNAFRSGIDSTTSRGGFAALMARFAMSLRDAHTWVWDTVVTFTPLSPGVPLLVLYPFATAEHFGAVLTALPDSTALVLRTVPNHPLGLQPGDIVLGYEGVPWKRLVFELLDAGLPVFGTGVGAIPAEIHSFIRNAGNNWHLFETIDIRKHSTGDTLHLSVAPLVTLPPDPMMGNEQLEIPGIPMFYYEGWPFEPSGQLLTYGKLPGLNVGYIRLVGEHPSVAADPQFAAAVDALWDTDGLILDLRWNSGGWSEFDAEFSKVFSERHYTTKDAIRSSASSFSLRPMGNQDKGLIPGVPGTIYDRPFAVLLGPTCVSLGDWTAQRLRYHPMVRFFGKTSIASIGFSEDITGWADWWMKYSITDVYHISQPGAYLNRRDFPIDEPVWFNADDVAQGVDPVVASAVEWISTLTYMHDVAATPPYSRPGEDSLEITAVLQNPGGHAMEAAISVTEAGLTILDSVPMHSAGLPGDTLWRTRVLAPAAEGKFAVDLTTHDLTDASTRSLPAATLFTTAGPVTVVRIVPAQPDSIPNSGDQLLFRFLVRNDGKTAPVSTIRGRVQPLDTLGAVLSMLQLSLSTLGPGESRLSNSVVLGFSQWGSGERDLPFEITFSSDGTDFWKDTVTLRAYERPEVVQLSGGLPTDYELDQNHPNPFNPSTTITYAVPRAGIVTLKVFNILGQEVATLIAGHRVAGEYSATWDATGMPSGVYVYRLTTGEFVGTKKAVLMR
jgi:hypothetical protein